MHDNPKAGDPIYEAELRSKMKALTNLLNDADRQITEAERVEYTQLTGKNTTENGAIEEVNDILMQIGNLNRQIKQNQILGQQSLELMDERNLLLDELSSYIPIEVTYYKDQAHDGIGADGKEALGEQFYLDKNNQPIAKKEWPDDLRVEMLYTDAKGQTHKLTLVEGTEGTGSENYGKLSIDPIDKSKNPYPSNFKLTIEGSKKNLADKGGAQETLILQAKTNGGIRGSGTITDNGDPVDGSWAQLTGGSIQASLDMLWKNNGKDLANTNDNNDYRGYEYYRQQLDTLAAGFASVMNNININGTNPKDDTWYLLANKDKNQNANITAGNIGLNINWVNGTIGVSTSGENPTDTLLNMMEAMVTTFPYNNDKDHLTTGTTAMGGANKGDPGNPDLKGNSFADFMNNVSTTLANDSYSNTYLLKNNVTVLNAVQNSRDAVSGVSLDEEASNMMMYQAAYNAASRLMTALDEVLNTLISGTGVCGR